MRIQTILNRVEKFKSFVYRSVRLEEQDDGPALVVSVEHRKNNRPVCSGCGKVGPAYDHLEERRFEFVPIWGVLVYLAYRMRRVDCKRCGVTVELVPWCDGKNRLTTTYRWYLATWARRLSWSEVGAIFRTSWDSVCRAVEYAVEWGLAHRDLSEVTALGIDEVAWARAGWPRGIAPPGLPQIRTCPLGHTARHIMLALRDGTPSGPLGEAGAETVPASG
jgi:transposase